MAIYIFSDDNYFSTGLSNLINKENTTIHSYDWEQWEPNFIHRQIGYGDILLLDGSNKKFIKKSLCFQLNQHGVKVFIFYDNRKKLLPVFAHWPHGAKNMGVKNLNDTLARLYRHPVQQGYHPGRLTRRESQVIGLIYRCLPSYRIALELSISVKTISNHKKNALRKLGVGSINALLV